LVIINWLVGAGLSISKWASEIAGQPAPTKCDIRKTNGYHDLKAIAFDFALHTLTGLADFKEIGKLLLEKKLIVAGGQN
jgi:nucleotidyltransferase/DNA polymerase involved in DNA repair